MPAASSDVRCAIVGLTAAGLIAVAVGMTRQDNPKDRPMAAADQLFDQQHWLEALTAYDGIRDGETDWRSPRVRHAVERAVECCKRLQLWDDAFQRAEQYIAKVAGTFEEAVGRRFLAVLYMSVPHHGTKRGGQFLRGEWTQGVHVQCFKKDRKTAIENLEKARALLAQLAARLVNEPNASSLPAAAATEERAALIESERIGVNLDLAGTLSQQSQAGWSPWGWCGWWWSSGLEAEEDSDAVDDADYEEPRYWGWAGDVPPPAGLPLGPDGQPQFIRPPAEYSPALGDGAKIRFVLSEIERIDTTENKDSAADALYRWAMIARSLYGPEVQQAWRNYFVRYDNFGRPLPQDNDQTALPKNIWELADDEAITLVGGRLRVVTLPPSENPIAVLRLLEEKYPKSAIRPEAQYARALYYQTRQQFPQAIREYESLLESQSQSARGPDAKKQIERIKTPQAMLNQAGVVLPDGSPKIGVTYRNTDTLNFTAYRVDLSKHILEQLEDQSRNYWEYRQLPYTFIQQDKWRSYIKKTEAQWTERVPLPEGHRAADIAVATPLSAPGAYVIELAIPKSDETSQVLLLVSDIAIVQKRLDGRGLIYVADARSGQPLAQKAVRVYEHWSRYDQGTNASLNLFDVTTLTTSADGVIEYKRKHEDLNSAVDAVVLGDNDRMAFSFFQQWYYDSYADQYENGSRYYVITDRPVYRPNDTVRFRIWVREREKGKYREPTDGSDLNVAIYDAKNNQVKQATLKTDALGGASGDYTLGDEPPLGLYHIRINGDAPNYIQAAGGIFRVEEYRKPEFEVTVKPSATHARLGDKLKAKVEARYYFGGPVARGDISYKVFREDYHHVYFGQGEYDWLYGPGYGWRCYPSPWLPWWREWGWTCCVPSRGLWPSPYFGWSGPTPWGYYGDPAGPSQMGRQNGYTTTRRALRELVAQGSAALREDGTYEVEFDTAKAAAELADRDHRYTIEVEVRDASRRTIEGRGSVTVTRQSFYAFIELDRGWYSPGNEVFVNLHTLTADNTPVAAKGELAVYRVEYGGANNADVREHEVQRWPAETDVSGRLALRYAIPGQGQYRLVFETKDDAGKTVQGNAVFWACGPKFDGRVYRFNDLEIIADKRTYNVGETAHLLLNTAVAGGRVLFGDRATNGVLHGYRFIDLPGRSTIIDVPIGEQDVPNFFVEATLVRDGRVHTEMRELFVPPSRKLLTMKIETDKPQYKPGEKGRVRVEVADADGKPARGQVALTAFDEAVTYVQDEFGPSPRVFFHGQKRWHVPQSDTSIEHMFHARGNFERVEWSIGEGGVPPGWQGYWLRERLGLDFDAADRRGGLIDALKSKMEPSAAPPAGQAASRNEGQWAMAGGGGVARRQMAADESKLRGRFSAEGFAGPDADGGPGLIEPEMRKNFADTALWLPALDLDETGRGSAEITFPESLTTWRIRGYAITAGTQVGDAKASAKTSKNLLVRLQAPRFFVERDEVVLSANVHNYLDAGKDVRAELLVPAELFEPLDTSAWSAANQNAQRQQAPGRDAPDKDGMLHLTATASVSANGEQRFDWPLRVKKAGLAKIAVRALTDQESDAMQIAFPVLVHGVNKTIAQSGQFKVDESGEQTMKLDLPADIDPEQTQLEITLSPSLAGVMIDALPYLIGYPYGCVEQTMSRFYPCVLVSDVLKQLGTDLETIRKQRAQMNPDDVKHRFGYANSPVFDTNELKRMVEAGLLRLYSFQRPDGGWGWWREDESSPFQTVYVLQGLHAARKAGWKVDDGSYSRGLEFLRAWLVNELAKPKEKRWLGDRNTQAYMAYVLALESRLEDDTLKTWFQELFDKRGELTNYGRCLLALALHTANRAEDARTVLRNVLQFVERDDTNATAWVRTPARGWWFWYNNDIETNAWALKTLVTLDPKSDLAPRIVKWLLNNRRNGYYWRGTRDTAQTIAAMVEYMRASGEAAPDYALTVLVDGKPLHELRVNRENFFTFANRVSLYGLQIAPGPHVVAISKQGSGALYHSAYLSYFTKEEDVKGAGNEIFVQREYFKLVPKTETVRLPDAAAGNTPPANRLEPLASTGHQELRSGWTRVPLKTGERVTSGERIEVVLTITSKNVYDFLVFEDFKPAGCEPVELRSGGRWAGGLCANVELRDEKVAFFIGLLEQGRHVLRYQMRAETPGMFHALPTRGHAMYAPEVRAISDEMRLGVTD